MKAMILAAGRGERLRPLTDHTPKPLIDVGGKALIAHHLQALAAAGFCDVVINVAYRGEQIRAALGDGRDFGLRIAYSVETPGALDTGGGVGAALGLVGHEPFALVSADVYTDYDFASLPDTVAERGAHLVLVDNPEHHPGGDFGLRAGALVDAAPRYTYAGIGVYTPALFTAPRESRFSLASVIRTAIAAGTATGAHHAGAWVDVGRPAALKYARGMASSSR